MTRTLSLLTPSGRLTLGSYLGALSTMRERQDDAFYGVSDLHAMTTDHDPAVLRARADEVVTLFLALGLDRATLFRQSHVPAHTALAHLLECVATTGELGRMIQFKEKSRRHGGSVRVSLFTYPVLMAADILLYQPEVVPVGDDQRQHVELTRDLAPAVQPPLRRGVHGARAVTASGSTKRVMDLLHPERTMSKSADAAGSLYLLDPPDVVRRKIARAVTDSDTGPDAVRRSADKPGVTNLLAVLEACGGSAAGLTSYGTLKSAVTEAVVATLDPIQAPYAELARDPAYVTSVFAAGAKRCRSVTEPVLAAARAAVGL